MRLAAAADPDADPAVTGAKADVPLVVEMGK